MYKSFSIEIGGKTRPTSTVSVLPPISIRKCTRVLVLKLVVKHLQ